MLRGSGERDYCHIAWTVGCIIYELALGFVFTVLFDI